MLPGSTSDKGRGGGKQLVTLKTSDKQTLMPTNKQNKQLVNGISEIKLFQYLGEGRIILNVSLPIGIAGACNMYGRD
jgi:hypothetical protein